MSALSAAPTRQDATEFAVRSADALARTFNLRRTLGRIVDLAVPRFGTRAAVAVVIDGRVRTAATGSDGATGLGRAAERQLAASLSRRASLPPDTRVHSEWPSDLTAIGLPADELGAATAVTTVALHDAGTAISGTLTVCGPVTEPPSLDELINFARRASVAVSAAQVFEERAELAERLRASLLPAPLPNVPGVQLGASYRPARDAARLGGDFYDVFPAGDGSWSVSIGDVCGKGVDAAVLTGQVRQSLRTASRVSDDPAAVLRLVNDTLLTGDGSTYVTLLQATMRIDPDGVRIRLAAGGHPPPLLLRSGRVEAVPAHGTIVGMLEQVEFTAVDVDLAPGDTLLMFTDGALEAPGPTGPLGVRPIAAILADCVGLTAQAVTERVLQLVVEHVGTGDGRDDIAVLAVRAEAATS